MEQAFLYGSFARGRPGWWSDIDVAFISPDYRPEHFPDKDPLAAEIRRSGIPLLL